MTFRALPTRIDQDLMAATDNAIEFEIIGDNGPINITNDTIEMRVMDMDGGDPVLGKRNLPGQHSNPTQGKTIFTFTATELLTGDDVNVRWWYETRRIAATTSLQRVHVVGELNLSPSIVRR